MVLWRLDMLWKAVNSKTNPKERMMTFFQIRSFFMWTLGDQKLRIPGSRENSAIPVPVGCSAVFELLCLRRPSISQNAARQKKNRFLSRKIGRMIFTLLVHVSSNPPTPSLRVTNHRSRSGIYSSRANNLMYKQFTPHDRNLVREPMPQLVNSIR